MLLITLFSLFFIQSKIQCYTHNAQKSDYKIIYDNQGFPKKIQILVEQLSVPIIDGHAIWPEAQYFAAQQNIDLNSNLGSAVQDLLPQKPNLPTQPIQDFSRPINLPRGNNPEFILPQTDFTKLNQDSDSQSSNRKQKFARIDFANRESGFFVGTRLVPHYEDPNSLLNMPQEEFNERMTAAVVNHYRTLARYDMTPDQLKAMKKLWYGDFVNALLSKYSDNESVLLELWNEYKDNCRDLFGYLSEHEPRIAKAAEDAKNKKKRDLEKQLENARINTENKLERLRKQKLDEEKQRQETEQKIFDQRKKMYEACCNIDFFDSHLQQRADAVEQTSKEKYSLTVKSHEIDSQTAGFLQARGISMQEFKDISGTTIQHELVEEVVICYQKIAIAHYEYNVRTVYLTDDAIEVAQTSLECNKLGNLAIAGALSTLSDVMADTLISIGKGAYASVQSNIDLVLHPDQILEGAQAMGNAVCHVAYLVGEVVTYAVVATTANKAKKDAHWNKFKTELDDMTAVCKLCLNEFKKCPTQTKIEFATQIATDFIVAGKCLKVLSKIGTHLG